MESFQFAEHWGDCEFLIYGGERRSFGCFLQSTHAAAEFFYQQGIRKGDMVLILGANTPEWLLAFWSLTQLGAVVAMGNAWWSIEDILAIRDLIGPKLLVADQRRRSVIDAAISCQSLESLGSLWDASTKEKPEYTLMRLARPPGFEPGTIRLEGGCSIQLSYERKSCG